MTSLRVTLLLTFVFGAVVLYAQSLPTLPSFAPIEDALEEAYFFPAKDYQIKKLKSYDGRAKRYSAAYDTQGRLVKLEDYRYDSLRPNVTKWTYSDSSIVATTVVPPCPACSKSTRISTRLKSEKGYTVRTHVTRTYFKTGLWLDSTYSRKRRDGAQMDSVVYRNSKLVYSATRSFHANGNVKRLVIRDNSADIDYLQEDIVVDYDTAGNKLKQVMKQGGKLMSTRLYEYNTEGSWLSFKQSGEDGIIYYTELMEYNQDGLPLNHITRDSSHGYLVITEEEWRYDERGRYVWHSQTWSDSYFYRRYLNDSDSDYVELRRTSEVLRRTVVQTEGRIRTTTTSVHKNTDSRLPQPGVQAESDPLFREESIEEFDIVFQVPLRKTSYERDRSRPHAKTSETTYEYNDHGRIVKETGWRVERGVEKTITSTFQYNVAGQQTQVQRIWSTGEIFESVTRTYSERGTLLVLDSCRGERCSRDSFAYDSVNRLVFSRHKSMGTDIRTGHYSYACDALLEKRDSSNTNFQVIERAEYLPSCLPVRYTVTREWGVAKDIRWEYEFY